MSASSQRPSDEKIRLAEEFIEAGKQMLFPLDPASDAAAARAPTTPISREERLREIAIAFAEFFTEEELKGLIAFYRSPLGMRLIEARSALAPRLAKTVREMYKGRFEAWAAQMARDAGE